MLSGFAFPAVLKHGLLVLAVLCVLVFVAVEALIFTGMFHMEEHGCASKADNDIT